MLDHRGKLPQHMRKVSRREITRDKHEHILTTDDFMLDDGGELVRGLAIPNAGTRLGAARRRDPDRERGSRRCLALRPRRSRAYPFSRSKR